MRDKKGQFVKGHPAPITAFKKGCPAPKTAFKKGHIPWIKDKHHTIESRQKISQAKKGKSIKHSGQFTKEKISGAKNVNWKGGQCKIWGYVYFLRHNHPRANKVGYVKRSIIIMEERLGRYLNFKEIVHHINNIRDDDRFENLQLFKNEFEHKSFHCKKRGKFFKKGHIPWHKGRKNVYSQETIEKIRNCPTRHSFQKGYVPWNKGLKNWRKIIANHKLNCSP